MNKQAQKEILNIVKNNYQKIANDFNETRKKEVWPELYNLTEEVKNGDNVLDVGCGNGRLINAFKEKKINYLGIDSCDNLIKNAKKNFPDHRFLVCDMLNLGSFSDLNFDFVFSVAVLHHLPGQSLRIEALKQMRNKIKKDGKIIVSVWNLWNQEKYLKLIKKFFLLKLIGKNKMDFGDIFFNWRKTGSKRYYHAFTKRELKRVSKRAGLKIVKLYKDKYNYYAILEKA